MAKPKGAHNSGRAKNPSPPKDKKSKNKNKKALQQPRVQKYTPKVSAPPSGRVDAHGNTDVKGLLAALALTNPRGLMKKHAPPRPMAKRVAPPIQTREVQCGTWHTDYKTWVCKGPDCLRTHAYGDIKCSSCGCLRPAVVKAEPPIPSQVTPTNSGARWVDQMYWKCPPRCGEWHLDGESSCWCCGTKQPPKPNP